MCHGCLALWRGKDILRNPTDLSAAGAERKGEQQGQQCSWPTQPWSDAMHICAQLTPSRGTWATAEQRRQQRGSARSYRPARWPCAHGRRLQGGPPKGFSADFGMNEGHAQKWARQPRLTEFHLVSNSVIFGAVITDIHYKSHQVQKIEQICTPTNRASLDTPIGRWYLEYLPRVCGYWYVYCGNEHPRNFTASAGIAVQWASPSPRWQQWPVVGGRALSLCDSGEAHKVRWAISSQNTPCPQAEIKSTSYDCCGAAAARTRGSSLWELNWRPANSQFWRQHRLRWDLSWNTQSKYRPN